VFESKTRRFFFKCRNISKILTLAALSCSLIPAASQAQLCTSATSGLTLGFVPASDEPEGPPNCLGIWWCHPAEFSGTSYETRPLGCDPTQGPCAVRARVDVHIEGLERNLTASTPLPDTARFTWRSGDNFVGSCGGLGSVIGHDRGDAWIQLGGFQCGATPSSLYTEYELEVWTCPNATFCPQPMVSTSVNLTPAVVSSQLCPPPPKPWSCTEGQTCPACSGVSGGMSVAGGGASLGGSRFGGGAFLYYQAGGAGHTAYPMPADWTTLLGRYWSHSYAERIVPDPDAGHVWLLTEHATFREFTDGNLDGVYETAVPSDEYRQLTKTLSGWELRDLDGTVDHFDNTGRWLETVDRNGNATTATYTGGVLTRVDFPDGRHEDFTYHPSGKLASITEVGIDGLTSRAWSYTWTGDDLARVDRPDGTAWELFYGDATNPGYVTRLELVGTDASRRVEEAWEYDAQGNVIRNWQGDASFNGPNAVSKWELTFDNPLLPTQGTLTDPLGQAAVYDVERDPASRKPRIAQISGDCPTCGLGPNTQMFFDDPANPLRMTREIDARGITTVYEFDANGMMTSRTEAFGTALERTTSWAYDANFPALVTEIERPSASGDPFEFRRTLMTYDPLTGDQLTRTTEGFEDGVPFTYTTTTTYTAEGEIEEIDPPGYGTADVTSWTYDPIRGNLLPATRIDPLIGTTTFGYDAFNRRDSVTDVNGVVTETVYDALDRTRFIIQRGATPVEDLVTEFRYNVFGDLFQEILPRGNVIEYRYDPAGRLISIERKADTSPMSHNERTVYALDALGNRTREELQRWDGAGWVTESATERVYSTRCYVDRVVEGAGSANESITEYAFDCDGNLERIWDANHPSAGQTQPATTVYTYDELERVSAVTRPWGGAGGGDVAVSYGYDVQDHLTQVTDGEGGVTTYEWSDRDLMIRETSEVSGVTFYTYNEHGAQTERTDARGVTVAYAVDALDRVTFEDYPDDSLDVTRTYDDPLAPFSIGRLARLERDGYDTEYHYDRFGRIIRDGGLDYVLDGNGNREEILYPDGVRATYSFDPLDRHATLDLEVPGEPVQSIVTAASYLPGGPLAELTLGNGLVETHTFDERYYPDRITVAGGGALLDWDYTTDAVGNPTAITDLLSAAGNRTYAHQDVQYYLTQGDGPWGDLSWTYDRIGNRLSETRDGSTDTYTYVPNATAGNSATLDEIQLGAGGTRAYAFDAVGNQIQVAEGAEIVDLIYDDASRLAALENPAAGLRSGFLYDARSYLRHAEQTVPGQIFVDDFESGDVACWSANVGAPAAGACPEAPRVSPVYSSEGVLHYQLKPADLERYVLYFAGRPVAIVEAPAVGSPSYQLFSVDHLGTPILASDVGGAATWSGGFEPFGEDFSGALEANVYLRLPGQWDDQTWDDGSAIEIYYNVHRWLDPHLGRFTKVDPLGLVAGVNLFAYVESRPSTYIDPTGLQGLFVSPQDIKQARDRACAKRVFLQNYNDLREANWIGADGYFHCKANCQAVRCGPAGDELACILSDLREFSDRLFKGDPPSASEADQRANRLGRRLGVEKPDKSCQTLCSELRPKGLPGKY